MKLKALALLPLLLSAPAIVNAVDFPTDDDKMSYIMGMQIGNGLKMEGIVLEIDAFSAGITDMMAGNKPQLDEATATKVVEAFQKQKEADMAEAAAAKQKLTADFLAENAKKDGVVTTDSGLQYKIIEQGKGKSPTSKDKVTAHYTGKRIDGTMFDSSHSRGEPATFSVSGVIKGWQEALPLMKEGSKWQLVIPASLAYGEQGAGKDIGPNQTLIFDIELISIAAVDTGTPKK
jgi:FKBP-type peptidyl-prolyl cis-trans isomerase